LSVKGRRIHLATAALVLTAALLVALALQPAIPVVGGWAALGLLVAILICLYAAN
jgi:hypothetical protein